MFVSVVKNRTQSKYSAVEEWIRNDHTMKYHKAPQNVFKA